MTPLSSFRCLAFTLLLSLLVGSSAFAQGDPFPTVWPTIWPTVPPTTPPEKVPPSAFIPPPAPQEQRTETISETDFDALASAINSGVPLTAAQSQLLASLSQTLLQDLNARLFRLRGGVNFRTGAAGPTGKEIKAPVEETFHRWEIFAAGDYGYFDLDASGRTAGFTTNTWAATLGAEYRVNADLAFGLAGSYANSRAVLSNALGSVDTAGAAVSAYASYTPGDFYADLLYSFGAYEQNLRRNTGIGRTARGDTDVITNAIQFNTGYNFTLGELRTGPIAALNWFHADVDGYAETGGGRAGLNIPDNSSDSLVSSVGWQASYVVSTGFGLIVPQIRATWDHEYLNSAQTTSATLQQSPFANGRSFTATGSTPQAGRDYLNLGGGVGARFGERVFVTLDYATQLFRDNATAHLGSVKVEVLF